MNNKMVRLWSAWIIGIISWLVITTLLETILHKIGVTTYIDFGEWIVVSHREYEEEINGAFTTAGASAKILATMFAARIGLAIYAKKLDGGVSKKGNIIFIAWAAGLTLYGIIGAIIFYLFEDVTGTFFLVILRVIDLAFAIGIFLLMKHWIVKKIEQIGKEKNQAEF